VFFVNYFYIFLFIINVKKYGRLILMGYNLGVRIGLRLLAHPFLLSGGVNGKRVKG
jgi:hypothetical protein